MNAGMDTMMVQKDTTGLTRHIRSILELNHCISLNKQNQLNYQSRYYSNDDHNSVPLIAEYDALHFIFSFYPLKLTFDEYLNINMALIARIEKHYSDITSQMGYKVKVPEHMANYLGQHALSIKHFNEAVYLFRLNIANYPGSYIVYDSMGDYYEAMGDKPGATDNYKKSLAIKENPGTRKKLDKLNGQ
jgi:hypothetical protein